jgi:hypothetical protein
VARGEGRRFSRPEAKFRLILGVIWLGAVALATLAALVNRPDGADVATRGAFYLVFLTIPGVLLAVVMIKRRSILVTTAVLAAAWSMRFSWGTMRSTRMGAGVAILLTPMVAFVIVAIGCVLDLFMRRGRGKR